MPQKIPSSDRPKIMESLKDWEATEGRDAIHKSFQFKNFVEAFAFMGACADYAEEIGHHPEWFNVYNRVDVTLTTHDVGDTLSDLDVKMAEFMNSHYEDQ